MEKKIIIIGGGLLVGKTAAVIAQLQKEHPEFEVLTADQAKERGISSEATLTSQINERFSKPLEITDPYAGLRTNLASEFKDGKQKRRERRKNKK